MRLRRAFLLLALSASADAAPSPALSWAHETASPSPVRGAELSTIEQSLIQACGRPDGVLQSLAAEIAMREVAGLAPWEADELTFMLRARGEPHVWPRMWVVSGAELDGSDARRRLDTWRRSQKTQGDVRCGAAFRSEHGRRVVSALLVDALADMAPLPLRARPGGWLTWEAELLVPAESPRVLVLGPLGAPRTVPVSFDGRRVRARFAPDQPGSFTVQLMATGERGPRPLLEALVFADVEPPDAPYRTPAPGEGAAAGETTPSAVLRMINAARAGERLGPIRRDARLDAVALAHGRAMRTAHTVAHDLGSGDPRERIESADIPARVTGENLAHARSIVHAHRALWSSPSHRLNVIHREFTHVGIAVVPDTDGSVWVVQEFAALH